MRFAPRQAVLRLILALAAACASAAGSASSVGALLAPGVSTPGKYVSLARAMLSQGWSKSQVLNIVALECPPGVGNPDPTCVDAYLLALRANASLNTDQMDGDPPFDWSGEDGSFRVRQRNAQWLEWLGVAGAAPEFDSYRAMAVDHYLGMSQPQRALLVLAPLMARLSSLAPSLAQRVQYAHLSGLLETGQDAEAAAQAYAIQTHFGDIDSDFLRYMASHWLRRSPQRLDAWRDRLARGGDTDILALLDWRENRGNGQLDAGEAPVRPCCTRSRYVELNLTWLSNASLRLLQGQAIPSLPRVMQAADLLLMAAPRAGMDAALWWRINESAWQDAQNVLPLPQSDDALWRRANGEGSALTAEQIRRFAALGWEGDVEHSLRRQILLHLASHAADGNLRLKALIRADVGGGNTLMRYRLVAHDPALLRGLRGTPYPAMLLLEAARQSRVPAADAARHIQLGWQLSALCDDLDLSKLPPGHYPHAEVRAEEDRIHSLLVLRFQDEAARIALHDMREIFDDPHLNEGWRRNALRVNLDVLRSMRQHGNTQAARGFIQASRALLAQAPGVGTPAERREFDLQ